MVGVLAAMLGCQAQATPSGPSGTTAPATMAKAGTTPTVARPAATTARPPTGKAPATLASPVPESGDLSWIEALRQKAHGQAIFLVRGPDGMVFGRSSDGTIRQDLLRSEARFPLLDGGIDLLWLREGTNVSVVDLRAKTPRRIPIARAVPADVSLRVQRMANDEVVSLSRTDVCSDEFISIAWYVTRIERYLVDAEADLDTSAKLIGKAWLKANKDREGPTEPGSLNPWDHGAAAPIVLPGALTKCAEGADCKRSIDFGAKGWQLVVAGATNKDPKVSRCFSYSCLLYDPKTRTFASPEDPGRWGPPDGMAARPCGPFLFDSAGKEYLTRSHLCDLDHGCRDAGGEPIGWLPFGPRIEVGY
jgi:hypothetical protein